MTDNLEQTSADKADPQEAKNRFGGTIRLARQEDIPKLQPILEEWIRDWKTHELIPEEITGVIAKVQGAVEAANTSTYLIAETPAGEVVGMLGMQPMDPALQPLATTEQPVEVTNVYVAGAARGTGVGTSLFEAAADNARQAGFTETIWNSGPRYKDSAWGFYNHKFGEPISVLKDFYGEGADAPVWHEVLTPQ